MAAKPMKLDDDGSEEVTLGSSPITEQVQEGEEWAKKTESTRPRKASKALIKEISRQGDQVRPYCRLHHVLMRAAKTTHGVTSYACPVPDCKETAKKAQPRSVIPREPQECPKCRQRNAEQEVPQVDPVYCQVDFSRSTSGSLMLVCPTVGCDFHVLVPRPDVAARSRRMRADEELTTG